MNKITDDELMAAALGLRWYADLIIECLPLNHWRSHKLLRGIAKSMREKALEIELPVLVRRRWAFINPPDQQVAPGQ